MEWLRKQRSSERWHMCAANFFNDLCVILNFFNETHVKASQIYLEGVSRILAQGMPTQDSNFGVYSFNKQKTKSARHQQSTINNRSAMHERPKRRHSTSISNLVSWLYCYTPVLLLWVTIFNNYVGNYFFLRNSLYFLRPQKNAILTFRGVKQFKL